MPPLYKTLQSAAAALANGEILGLFWKRNSTAVVDVTGTFVATVTFEVTVDHSTWRAIEGKNVSDGTVASSATAPGMWVFDTSGWTGFRARVSAFTSGTVTVRANSVAGAPGSSVSADIQLQSSDVQIGAVEIKNATTDDRAVVQTGSPAGTELGLVIKPDARRGSFTDRSGSITLGGTSQQLAAALTTRRTFFVQNVSTADLWVNFGVAAVQDQPSVRVSPNSSLELDGDDFVSTEVVNIIGATTGQKFAAKEA